VIKKIGRELLFSGLGPIFVDENMIESSTVVRMMKEFNPPFIG
jgi:hypothetical protein